MTSRVAQFSLLTIMIAAGTLVSSQKKDTTDAADNARQLVQMERDWADALVKGDVAILDGTANGQDITGQYRFTDTFIKEDTQWHVVATQATRIQAKQP